MDGEVEDGDTITHAGGGRHVAAASVYPLPTAPTKAGTPAST